MYFLILYIYIKHAFLVFFIFFVKHGLFSQHFIKFHEHYVNFYILYAFMAH